jgi:hypothetical protein
MRWSRRIDADQLAVPCPLEPGRDRRLPHSERQLSGPAERQPADHGLNRLRTGPAVAPGVAGIEAKQAAGMARLAAIL